MISDANFIKIQEVMELAVSKASIACKEWFGKNDRNAADYAAVSAMRDILNNQDIFTGKIVIGEGERDEAPMLYIGEVLGNGEIHIDIAVDPLEGTNFCANGLPGSLCVLAFGEKDSILASNDCYMEKIACKSNASKSINLNNDIIENIHTLSTNLKKPMHDICVTILERDRHSIIIDKICNIGAKINLISDGDIMGIIDVFENDKFDLYYGIGGAPEGVITACYANSHDNCFMQGRLVENNQYKGLIMNIEDMAKGKVSVHYSKV